MMLVSLLAAKAHLSKWFISLPITRESTLYLHSFMLSSSHSWLSLMWWSSINILCNWTRNMVKTDGRNKDLQFSHLGWSKVLEVICQVLHLLNLEELSLNWLEWMVQLSINLMTSIIRSILKTSHSSHSNKLSVSWLQCYSLVSLKCQLLPPLLSHGASCQCELFYTLIQIDDLILIKWVAINYKIH